MNTQYRKHGWQIASLMPVHKTVVDLYPKELYRNEIRVPKRKEGFGIEWSDCAKSQRHVSHWAWMSDRLNYAKHLYTQAVDVDPLILGGLPVIKGTRMPVSTILAEIANGMSLPEIAEDYSLDRTKLHDFFQCISIAFDRPQNEYDSTRRVHELEAADKDVRD